MYRKMFSVCLATLMAVSLTACGGSNSSAKSDGKTADKSTTQTQKESEDAAENKAKKSGAFVISEDKGPKGFVELAYSGEKSTWFEVFKFNEVEEPSVLRVITIKDGKATTYGMLYTPATGNYPRTAAYAQAGLVPLKLSDIAHKTDEEILAVYKEYDKKAFEIDKKLEIERMGSKMPEVAQKVPNMTYEDYRRYVTDVQVEAKINFEGEHVNYFAMRNFEAMEFYAQGLDGQPDFTDKNEWGLEGQFVPKRYSSQEVREFGSPAVKWRGLWLMYEGLNIFHVTRQYPDMRFEYDKAGPHVTIVK